MTPWHWAALGYWAFASFVVWTVEYRSQVEVQRCGDWFHFVMSLLLGWIILPTRIIARLLR